MVKASLPKVFQMVFSKVVLYGNQLIARRWLAAFRRGQRGTERAALENIPAGNFAAGIKPAEKLQRGVVLDQVIHRMGIGEIIRLFSPILPY